MVTISGVALEFIEPLAKILGKELWQYIASVSLSAEHQEHRAFNPTLRYSNQPQFVYLVKP